MSTNLIDTGEAYLSSEEKRFVRGVTYATGIARGSRRALPFGLATLALGLGVAGLTFLASLV